MAPLYVIDECLRLLCCALLGGQNGRWRAGRVQYNIQWLPCPRAGSSYDHTVNASFVYQTIFAIVNATDAITAPVDRFNAEKPSTDRSSFRSSSDARSLSQAVEVVEERRSEWAMAIRSLVENHLCHLPPQAAQSSDAFRRRICYIEQVSTVLEAHKATLNAIYNRYAYANQSIHDIMRDDGMLSIGEWLTLIDHLGLTASGQISPHQAKMIFMWSRLRRYTNEHSNTIVTLAKGWHAAAERAAIDKAGGSGPTAAAASPSKSSKGPDLTAIDKSERRLRHLSRHDFQEALVRMATMVALPTDEEIEEAGAADAGDFLIAMQAHSPTEYAQFVSSRKPTHSDPDGSDFHQHSAQVRTAQHAAQQSGTHSLTASFPFLQPVWRCVEHLVKIIVRTIEGNASTQGAAGASDGVVQEDEMDRFLKQRSKGLALTLKSDLNTSEMDWSEVMEGGEGEDRSDRVRPHDTIGLQVQAAAIKGEGACKAEGGAGRLRHAHTDDDSKARGEGALPCGRGGARSG